MSVKPQPAMTFYEMPPAVYNLAAVPSYPIQGTVSPNVPPEVCFAQPLIQIISFLLESSSVFSEKLHFLAK